MNHGPPARTHCGSVPPHQQAKQNMLITMTARSTVANHPLSTREAIQTREKKADVLKNLLLPYQPGAPRQFIDTSLPHQIRAHEHQHSTVAHVGECGQYNGTPTRPPIRTIKRHPQPLHARQPLGSSPPNTTESPAEHSVHPHQVQRPPRPGSPSMISGREPSSRQDERSVRAGSPFTFGRIYRPADQD